MVPQHSTHLEARLDKLRSALGKRLFRLRRPRPRTKKVLRKARLIPLEDTVREEEAPINVEDIREDAVLEEEAPVDVEEAVREVEKLIEDAEDKPLEVEERPVVLEDDQYALRLLEDKRVRLCMEHMAHRLRFGNSGTVLQVRGDRLKVSFDGAVAALEVPAQFCESVKDLPNAKALRTMDRISFVAKQYILRCGGVTNPLEDVVETLEANEETLCIQQVDLWAGLLRFTFNEKDDGAFTCVPIAFSLMLLEDVQNEDSSEAAAFRLRTFKLWWHEAACMVLPIWAMGQLGGHFTCLRLMKFDGGALRADYFESLSDLHKGCFSACKTLMGMLDLTTPPLRRNAARQVHTTSNPSNKGSVFHTRLRILHTVACSTHDCAFHLGGL